MSTKNGSDSVQSPVELPSVSSLRGGLFLDGMVIAVKTEEREWEKQRYTQTIISVSDGETVYLVRQRHDNGMFRPPALFKPIKVRVTRAATEKGQITVAGEIFE